MSVLASVSCVMDEENISECHGFKTSYRFHCPVVGTDSHPNPDAGGTGLGADVMRGAFVKE